VVVVVVTVIVQGDSGTCGTSGRSCLGLDLIVVARGRMRRKEERWEEGEAPDHLHRLDTVRMGHHHQGYSSRARTRRAVSLLFSVIGGTIAIYSSG
jgi:hypothetical protein